MSLEDFQLLDNEPFDNSLMKQEHLKTYHHQGVLVNDPDQNMEFISGENNYYHQIGNSYLEFDITVRNPTSGFNKNAEIQLVKNTFAHCFKKRTLSTTGGMELEQTKYIGQVSTIMRVLTSKDGDLLSYFDYITDNDAITSMNNNSLKEKLINNHGPVANRGKMKGHLPLEHIFGFCKMFKKVTKNLGFHLISKTNDL